VRVSAVARLAQAPIESLTDSQRPAFEKALKEFRESQSLSLDHAGGHLTMASLERQLNHPEQAIEHLSAAIKLEPYLAGPRAELASLLQQNPANENEVRRLRTEEADLLERDARLAPENADISYRLGLLRYTLDDLDRAEAAFQQACEKAPRNYEYRMALALLQEKRYELTGDEQRLKAAVVSLNELRKLNEKDPRANQIINRLNETYKEKEAAKAKAPGT
jgi:tetratricopeptide (TPR) repeat protein